MNVIWNVTSALFPQRCTDCVLNMEKQSTKKYHFYSSQRHMYLHIPNLSWYTPGKPLLRPCMELSPFKKSVIYRIWAMKRNTVNQCFSNDQITTHSDDNFWKCDSIYKFYDEKYHASWGQPQGHVVKVPHAPLQGSGFMGWDRSKCLPQCVGQSMGKNTLTILQKYR